MEKARKGMAIETVIGMVVAIFALAVLLLVLSKTTPALSKFMGTFASNLKNTICDKFGFVKSLLCKAVI